MPEAHFSAKQVLRYCAVAAGAALTLMVVVATFNAVVDPFAMYRGVTPDGFDAQKPAVLTRVRLHKAFELRRIRPEAIILGSSRTHIGLRCSHPGWAELRDACYNVAFDGATTREMYAYLVHAQALHPLRRVVLGLDSYHAVPAPSFVRPDFDPLVLRGEDTPTAWYLLTADLRLLTSMSTVRASIDTLLRRGQPERSWFAPDGQRLGDIFFRRPEEDFVAEGPRAYFDKVDRLEVGYQTEGAGRRTGGAHDTAAASDVAGLSSLAYVERIVEFCRTHDIALTIFITPSHAHQLEIAAATGAWPTIENGKRALATLLAEDARRHPRQPAFPLFDFARYSSVTTEPLPPEHSDREMRFYWDSSHFKANVGDWVLDRVLGGASSAEEAPADFGVAITAENVDTVLAQQRGAQALYRQHAAAELAPLQELVRLRLETNAALPVASIDAPARR